MKIESSVWFMAAGFFLGVAASFVVFDLYLTMTFDGFDITSNLGLLFVLIALLSVMCSGLIYRSALDSEPA